MSSTSATAASSSSSTASSQFTYTTGMYFPTPFHLQQPQTYVAAAAAASILQFPAPPPAVPHVYPAPATVPTVYSLPQYQQAQQLFQRDAQTITLEALESVKAALASSEIEHKAETKKKAVPRKAAGQAWEDPTLADWPENDSRLFCGDLGNEVNDDVLSKAFSRFPSFNMARVSYLNSSTFYMSQPSLVRIIETLICLLVVVAFGEVLT
nr:RNA-binding protein 42-like isoform X1 [Coffea arabica]